MDAEAPRQTGPPEFQFNRARDNRIEVVLSSEAGHDIVCHGRGVSLGRPTKLDDLTAKRIVDAVKAGVSRRAAANGAGVGYSTLKEWLAAGRRGEVAEAGTDFPAFLAKLEAAEASAEREMVDCIFLAAKEGKHDAAKFWLSSRRAAEWAAKTTVEAEESAADEQSADDISVARSVLAALESRKAG